MRLQQLPPPLVRNDAQQPVAPVGTNVQNVAHRRLLPLRQHPKNGTGTPHGRVVRFPPPPHKQNKVKVENVVVI